MKKISTYHDIQLRITQKAHYGILISIVVLVFFFNFDLICTKTYKNNSRREESLLFMCGRFWKVCSIMVTGHVIKFIWGIESKTTVSLNNFYYTFIFDWLTIILVIYNNSKLFSE